MNTKTDRCLTCDATVYADSVSERGWCTGCENEFARLQNQLEARRILQLPLPLVYDKRYFRVKSNG